MTDIDFDIKPRRPKLSLKPTPRPYEPTCTITCACCGQRATIAVQWPGRICSDCRVDLRAARQRAQQRLDDAAQAFEPALASWTDYQDALPDDVREKWFSVKTTQTKLETSLNKALLGAYKALMPVEERQRIIAACRAKLDEHMAKVERTRHAPQHMLYAVLARESEHQQALDQANEETMAATIALQELDAAAGESQL